jgi:light-regulated signal transduction histidine kinase (bacteriophytochrome)
LVLENEGTIVLAAIRDITLRKKSEIEIKKLNEELKAFSYSVSHDLRAPLRSIDGFSNIILKNYGHLLDDQGKDYLNRVMNASRHMGQLIDDMLKLSRLTRVGINIELINLSSIAESVSTELRNSNPERKADFIIQPEMMVNADPNLMRIAIENLLGNAWKYSNRQIETKIEFGTFINKDNKTVFFIHDNGVGFDMKYVNKLFGAFQRLHGTAEFEGSGIGLATVQRIIHRHGGTIWAEGEINNGATFCFML